MIKEKPYSCNWKYLITVFLFMFLGPGYAAAQTVLTESFSYPSGKTLVGYNWTQMNAGANAITLVKGNLEFNGAIGSGIGNKIALANNGQDLYRTFPVTSASLYSALVVNVSAANITGDYFLRWVRMRHLLLTLVLNCIFVGMVPALVLASFAETRERQCMNRPYDRLIKIFMLF